MNDTEKVKIEINIAGERVFLTVPSSMQKAARKTELNVSALYRKWRGDFPNKTEKELLVMLAFQYASHYEELLQRQENARLKAEEINSILDELLD